MNTTETKMIAIRETTASGKSVIQVWKQTGENSFCVIGQLGGKRAERAAAVVVGNDWKGNLGLIGCRQTLESARSVAKATPEGRVLPVMNSVEGDAYMKRGTFLFGGTKYSITDLSESAADGTGAVA